MLKSSTKKKVHFFYPNKRYYIKHSQSLKKFIERIFKEERKSLDTMNYIFCSDLMLLDINKKYLNHNYLTDIITFDLSEQSQKIKAEVYISIERVKENAIKFETSLNNEILRVMFHGVLHLCGYKDKTITQKKIMREKEGFYIKEYTKIYK